MNSASLFLGDCADFYEEVASIKRAHALRTLEAELAFGPAAVPAQPLDYARRVSARLVAILHRQQQAFRRDATPEQIRAQRVAHYLMAALADEVFVLELDWPGRAAWLDVLIEHQLFASRNAGSRVFTIASQLSQPGQCGAHGPALAAVFLFMLALGFKGCYRGQAGETRLHEIRAALYILVRQGGGMVDAADAGHAFAQAYQHGLPGGHDERLAPLSPWFTLGAWALAANLLLSSLAWLVLLHPFQQYIGG
jgi:type VI secretion system protein ImpK